MRVLVPRGGKNLKLVEMAGRNAEAHLRRQAEDAGPLEALQLVLGLPAPPRHIEGFDISNTGGEESVGSLVVFRDGRPDKEAYRKFLIRTVAGSNDVASLAEVVTRRYRKMLEDGTPLPDLVMVDGGKPQLGAAEKALAALGLSGVPLVSIAKKEEILYTPAHREGLFLERDLPRPQARPGRPRRDPPLRRRLPSRPPRKEKLRFAARRDPGPRPEEEGGASRPL